MNNKDYIRKAVELADGWAFPETLEPTYCAPNFDRMVHGHFTDYIAEMPQWHKDALATQLRRQVDATKDCWVETDNLGSGIYMINDWGNKVSVYCRDIWFENKIAEDISMNLIKMIVDSRKLEPPMENSVHE